MLTFKQFEYVVKKIDSDISYDEIAEAYHEMQNDEKEQNEFQKLYEQLKESDEKSDEEKALEIYNRKLNDKLIKSVEITDEKFREWLKFAKSDFNKLPDKGDLDFLKWLVGRNIDGKRKRKSKSKSKSKSKRKYSKKKKSVSKRRKSLRK